MKQFLVVGVLLAFALLAISTTSATTTEVSTYSTSDESALVDAAPAPVPSNANKAVNKRGGSKGKKNSAATNAKLKALRSDLKKRIVAHKALKAKYVKAKAETKRLKKLKKDPKTKAALKSAKKDKKGLKKALKKSKKAIKKLKKQIKKLDKNRKKSNKKSKKSKARLQKKLKKLQKKLGKLRAKKAQLKQKRAGKKASKSQKRKSKKISKKMKKIKRKICKVQKKLGKKCSKKGKGKNSKKNKKNSKKFKRFQGKKLNHKEQARLEKKLAKKRKQLAKWEGKRNNLIKEIGKVPATPRQQRRQKKQNKHISKLQKEIARLMGLLGKRETSAFGRDSAGFKANAEREKAAASLATKVTTPAGKQALTDFNQASDRLHQQQEDDLVKAKKDQELALKAIVDKQRSDQKLAEAKKLEETAFNDKTKAIVKDLKDQAAEIASKAKAETQLAAGDAVKIEEAKAKVAEQQIKDKATLAKAIEVLRTSVTPAGRADLETMQKAQETAAQALKDQARIASVTPTPVPPPTDADRIKDDPNGAFKKNDRTGVTAHEALLRIAKMHEENKLNDFSTSQMDQLLGTTADEPVVPEF